MRNKLFKLKLKATPRAKFLPQTPSKQDAVTATLGKRRKYVMRIFEDRNALSDMRCVCLLVYLLDPTVFRSFFGLIVVGILGRASACLGIGTFIMSTVATIWRNHFLDGACVSCLRVCWRPPLFLCEGCHV